jgi:predicted nicotinamide N-methyase
MNRVSTAPRLSGIEFVPEIRLHLFDAGTRLFDATGGEYRSDEPPPFWGFAWAGGQALARYLLDHPDVVRERRVLDLACGSGIVAVAAARAGAADVLAVDVDPAAVAAAEANARANEVTVRTMAADILDATYGPAGPDDPAKVDVVVAGDAFYSEAMAERVRGFLRRSARSGARVLIGDPDRGYLGGNSLAPLATYDIPVSSAVEGVSGQLTSVFELRTGTGPAR